jgi:hypothetical protein
MEPRAEWNGLTKTVTISERFALKLFMDRHTFSLLFGKKFCRGHFDPQAEGRECASRPVKLVNLGGLSPVPLAIFFRTSDRHRCYHAMEIQALSLDTISP